jgi:hypothetical protein
MYQKKFILALTAAASLCGVEKSSAFVATTAPATVQNINNNAAPGAQVGDAFSLIGGSFSSYVPGLGDPTITGGDLNRYRYNMDGTVASVVGATVTYSGTYRIFYDSDLSGEFNVGDFSYSVGTLGMVIDFLGVGPYVANGTLHQTSGPDAGFPSSGFANTDAIFTGTYQVTSTDGSEGTVSGVIRSAPDAGSSLALLGMGMTGLLAMRRRIVG